MAESEERKVREAIGGQLAATQLILRVLVLTHPNPDEFIRMFRKEYCESIVKLSVQFSASEVTKQAYRDFLLGIVPVLNEQI